MPSFEGIRFSGFRFASKGWVKMMKMKRFTGMFFGMLLTTMVCVPFTAEAAEKVALVIGMSDYKTIEPLDNTINDTQSIGKLLNGLGFEVETSLNQPLNDLVKTINAFSFKAETADVAMIYFAGHGVELNGQNFLIPVDVNMKKPEQIGEQAVSLKSLLGAVENARKLRIVILDSCRNNPFEDWPVADVEKVGSPEFQKGDVASLRKGGLAEPSADKGLLVVYAAKEGEVALDGADGHSPFARALINELPSRNVEIGMMFRQVRDRVMAETANQQQPHFYGSLSGVPFFLAGADLNIAGDIDKKKAWGSLAPAQEVQLASLANEGNTRGMLGLGYMALNPDDSRFKPQKAFEFFKAAADKDDPEAMFELAKLYEKGIGTKQDFATAVSLYQKSADLDYADAINDLGFLYFQGASGVSRNPEKAIRYFVRAADLRHPQAMYNIASMIDDGRLPGKTGKDAGHYLYAALRSGASDVLKQLSNRPMQFKLATRMALQKELAQNQLYSGSIDGHIGKETKKSMRIAFGETQ